MNLSSSSSVSRTPPSAERSSQRSERAPAGDFAALLDSLPASARAQPARVAERENPHRGAPEGHDERPGRPDATSPRSRHARPGSGRPAAAPGRDGDRLERSEERGRVQADATPAAPPPGAAAAGATAPADAASSPQPGPAPAGSAGTDTGMPGTEPAVTPFVGEAPIAAPATVAPGGLPASPLAGAHATSNQSSAPTATAAGLPPGATTAGAAATGPAAPAVLDQSATGAAPGGDPAAAGVHEAAGDAATPGGAGAASGAPGEHSDPGAAAGPVATALTSGAGGDAAGTRDGRTAGDAPTEEVAQAPSAIAAPTGSAAPVSASSDGRLPDAVPFGPQRSVPLERSPRAVAQLLHVASQQGVSHARIALRPVELGGIEIFLQVSPAGLAAQLIADSPEAARMLAQASEDLRRSLAGQNVELISLEVSTSAEHQQRDDRAASAFLAEDRTTGDARSAARGAPAGADTAAAAPDPSTPTVIELPDGLLVDVLA